MKTVTLTNPFTHPHTHNIYTYIIVSGGGNTSSAFLRKFKGYVNYETEKGLIHYMQGKCKFVTCPLLFIPIINHKM